MAGRNVPRDLSNAEKCKLGLEGWHRESPGIGGQLFQFAQQKRVPRM